MTRIKSEIRKNAENANKPIEQPVTAPRLPISHSSPFEFVLAALRACRSGSDFDIRISDFGFQISSRWRPITDY